MRRPAVIVLVLLVVAAGASVAGASRAEHCRNKFLRQFQVVTVGSVTAHEEPFRQTAFDQVCTVACGCLCNLRYECHRVSQQQILKLSARAELFHKDL